MKIKIDSQKLKRLMRKQGIKTFKQLALECGISLNVMWHERSRTGSLTTENLWLISDRLGVPINEFVYPEW